MIKAESKNSTDQIFTYSEAASYMRCSKVFIWKLRKEGKIKNFSAGKKILFQKSAIDSYLRINNSEVSNE